MKKKDRKLISSTISGLFMIISLYLYWIVFDSNNMYILFGIILATPFIEAMTYRMLPKNKKSNKKARSRIKHNSKKPKGRANFNRMREDHEIISSPLHDLSWREFERICYLYFKARGHKPKETSNGADGGVDLIIYNRYHKANEAVQIKHYLSSGNQITVKEIRELNSAKRNHNCVLARFITSSGFTQDALREADRYRIQCSNIDWVMNHIEKWRKTELEKMSS
ncbi:restriction endonuclease [Lentibacillus cibarius]|uniref:Restriction endonuclease n=1 Tax=Lentibacillus cibarius TaxID=2583219 RepID=A0A5S3QMW7_9BACI|nr:restriction endonuclease [Lentibacillus cibarius]TMN21826.1 restriction endonuclease [Lentibacillus cibarius]